LQVVYAIYTTSVEIIRRVAPRFFHIFILTIKIKII